MVCLTLEKTAELDQMTAGPVSADREECGAWWKGFYCILQRGHDGPHEDTGTAGYAPSGDALVAYDVFWTVKED